MPYLATSQEWLTQSHLLLEARPTTTRITTKYTITDPTKTKSAIKAGSKRRKTPAQPATAESTAAAEPSTSAAPAASTAPASRADLTLKTYDPVSGVTLKYRTTKAQEVGRLIASLGRLGSRMAGLPEVKEDEKEDAKEDANMAEAPVAAVVESNAGGTGESGRVSTPATAAGSGGGGAPGGKKKKKGKK